jgi:glycerophosphoryl diester phosphodiesterase
MANLSSDGGFLTGPEPRLFAHRGASAEAPENTLEAFELAWEEGAPYLEMDVRSSADGAVMVIHDASVSRTTGRRGRVENMTFDDIRRLDAGYAFTPDHGRTYPYRGKGITIPTLEEVFNAFPEARLNIEIKPSRPGVEQAVLDVIRRYGAEDRVFVAAHEHEMIERFRGLDGDVLTGFSKKEVREFLSRVKGKDFDGYRPLGVALQVPEYFGLRRVLSPAFIDAAHRLECEVHVWTVNQPLQMKRLLGWGVDGIMTDDPARAFDAVDVLGTNARRPRESRS